MVEAARHIGGYPTMMIRLLMAGALAGLIVSSPAFAQDKASQKFLKEAMEGNLAEVQMGQLAQKNGGSDRVRSFGQCCRRTIRTHTKRPNPRPIRWACRPRMRRTANKKQRTTGCRNSPA